MTSHLRSSRTILLVLVSAVCLLGLVGFTAMSAAVTVSVSPALTTCTVGDHITVDLVTDAVSDLKAYNLIVTFNPLIVGLTGGTAGGVLTGSGYPYQDFVLPDYTAPTDSAWYNAAVLNGSAAGPGTLVHLHFDALAAGITNVTWQKADFRDSQNGRTLPATVNGVIKVADIVPTKSTTWGSLRKMYGAGAQARVVVRVPAGR